MRFKIFNANSNALVTKICLLCLIKLFLTTSLIGETIQFSLHDGSVLTDVGATFDNQTSIGSFTQNDITLSMEALLDDDSELAELNGGAEGFGVNSDGLNDYTQRIDNTNGQEMIFFPSIPQAYSIRLICAILKSLQTKPFYLSKVVNNSV